MKRILITLLSLITFNHTSAQSVDVLGMDDGRVVFLNLGLIGVIDEEVYFIANSNDQGANRCSLFSIRTIIPYFEIKEDIKCYLSPIENNDDPNYLAKQEHLLETFKLFEDKISSNIVEIIYEVAPREIYELCPLGFSIIVEKFQDIGEDFFSEVSNFSAIIQQNEWQIVISQDFGRIDNIGFTRYNFHICE